MVGRTTLVERCRRDHRNLKAVVRLYGSEGVNLALTKMINAFFEFFGYVAFTHI